MKEPFELEWFGGVAEKHYRRLRPEVMDLPWGTIKKEGYPPQLIERARLWWTLSAVAEYRAAVAFGELLRAMLEAKVPLDLIGMGSEFVADEISHVEITSRIAMELGGGAPLEIDTTKLLWPAPAEADALQHVNERMLRVSCIHETFSGAMIAHTMRVSSQPLFRAAETLIARDEARHTRLGSLYFEWVHEQLTDDERARLSRIAIETLQEVSGSWQDAVPAASVGIEVRQLHELGRLDADAFGEHARKCVREDIVPTLARFGIEVPKPTLDELLR
jgi:hypothetical protein